MRDSKVSELGVCLAQVQDILQRSKIDDLKLDLDGKRKESLGQSDSISQGVSQVLAMYSLSDPRRS